MDVTMIGLQNAGKTSLLRVLSVSLSQIFPWQNKKRGATRKNEG